MHDSEQLKDVMRGLCASLLGEFGSELQFRIIIAALNVIWPKYNLEMLQAHMVCLVNSQEMDVVPGPFLVSVPCDEKD